MSEKSPHDDGLDAGTRGKLGALETIKEVAPQFALAKADRARLEHFRKSKKALLMIEAEREGHRSAAMQERYAYSHPEYIELLDGLHAAIEAEERLRFVLVAAESAIRIWQTRMASDRIERQVIR
jgi:hypothetical protein